MVSMYCFYQVNLRNFEQMTAYDESTGPPVIWRLLFAFVFLEYLNNCICFIFSTIFLVYKLLFSLSLGCDI